MPKALQEALGVCDEDEDGEAWQPRDLALALDEEDNVVVNFGDDLIIALPRASAERLAEAINKLIADGDKKRLQ
jgi:hypothetical protein